MSPTFGQIIGDPANSGVEIDIFEYVKITPTKVHFTIHWDGYGANHKKNYYGLEYPQIQDGNWHTFGLLWKPEAYEFYVDGEWHKFSTPKLLDIASADYTEAADARSAKSWRSGWAGPGTINCCSSRRQTAPLRSSQ